MFSRHSFHSNKTAMEEDQFMKVLFAALASAVICASATSALAYLSTDVRPHIVKPKWNKQGSAVCPDLHDYVKKVGACRARGAGSYAGILDGASVKPTWTRGGSAVCPSNYDYRARSKRNIRTGLCHLRPN